MFTRIASRINFPPGSDLARTRAPFVLSLPTGQHPMVTNSGLAGAYAVHDSFLSLPHDDIHFRVSALQTPPGNAHALQAAAQASRP